MAPRGGFWGALAFGQFWWAGARGSGGGLLRGASPIAALFCQGIRCASPGLAFQQVSERRVVSKSHEDELAEDVRRPRPTGAPELPRPSRHARTVWLTGRVFRFSHRAS